MTAAPITETTEGMTDEQRKQIRRMVEDIVTSATKDLDLSKDGAQRFIENGSEFGTRVKNAVTELAIPTQYADEERSSNYGYPNVHRVKGITEQGNLLRQSFSGIGFTNPDYQKKVETRGFKAPPGAEGPFVIPNPFTFAPAYGEGVERMLEMIGKTRKFTNYRKGQLGPDRLRMTKKTEVALRKIAEEQGNADLLIVFAQLGLRHRGRSVRRARVVMSGAEFGLEVLGVGAILLTPPERFQSSNDLWIDVAGNDYDWNADGEWSDAPIFYFYDGKLEFDAHWTDYAFSHYGSVSGFVPQ